MNIMKIDMLLDNKIRKINEVENPNGTLAPIPAEGQPKDGMNALMFKGAQNVMSNPGLAKQVGMNENYASSISFGKSRTLKKLMPYAFAALAGLGAMSMTSCTEKYEIEKTPVVVNVSDTTSVVTNVTVNNDNSAILALLEIWKKEWEDSDSTQSKIINDWYNDWKNDNMDEKQWRQDVINKMDSLYSCVQQYGVEFSKFQTFVMNIINDPNSTLNQKIDRLLSLIDNIDKNVTKLVNYADTAQQQRAENIRLLTDMSTNVGILVKQGEANLKADSILIEKNGQIYTKLSMIDSDMNRNAMAYLTQNNLQYMWLMRLLMYYGKSQQQAMDMLNNQTMASVLGYLKHMDETITNVDKKVADILEYLKNHQDDPEAVKTYREQVLALLRSIDGNVKQLLNIVTDFVKSYQADRKEDAKFRKDITGLIRYNNFLTAQTDKHIQENTGVLKSMDEKLGSMSVQLDSLIKLGNEKPEELKQVIKNASQEEIAAMKQLGIDITDTMNINTDRIIAQMKYGQDVVIQNQKTQIALELHQDSLIAGLYPLLQGLNSEELLKAIQTVGEKIDDAAAQNNLDNAEIIALLKKNNEELEGIRKSVDSIGVDVKDLSVSAKDYFSKSLTNQNMIKTGLAHLEVGLNTVIQQQGKGLKNDSILIDLIENIDTNVANIKTIGGGSSLTKEELAQVLGDFGNDFKAFLTQMNAEDMAEVKKLVGFAQHSDSVLTQILAEVKTLPKTIPDYSERLKYISDLMDEYKVRWECKCQCDCDDNDDIHEGITDIINSANSTNASRAYSRAMAKIKGTPSATAKRSTHF